MRLSSSKTTDGEFKTLEGGHTLRLPVKHEDLAPLNQPVFLAIRPEHVQLSTNDNSVSEFTAREDSRDRFCRRDVNRARRRRTDCCSKHSSCAPTGSR